MKKNILFLVIFSLNANSIELQKTCYEVDGMQCGACTEKIRAKLTEKIKNISIEISLVNATLELYQVGNELNENKIKSLIRSAGYESRKVSCIN
jgi:copper chaperone CopZ